MLRGTAWLTASNFISRLLGAIYIILGISGWGLMRLQQMVSSPWAIISMPGSCWFQQRVSQLQWLNKWPSIIPCEKKSIALP